MKLKLPSRAASPASLTLGILVLTLALFAIRIPILEYVEVKTYDLRFRARAPLKPSPAIAIAAVDEKSLEAIGQWPWPRTQMAALVDALSADGARVVAFDVVFAEADRDPEAMAGAVSAPAAQRVAPTDLAFADAIRRSKARVVLGYFFHLREEDLGHAATPDELAQRVARISASRFPIIASQDPDAAERFFIHAYAPQPNIDVLSEVAPAQGFFSVPADADGVVRRVPLVMKAGDDAFPALALVTAREFLGNPELVLNVGKYGVEGIDLGDIRIPTDESGQLLVNYLGPPKTFPHVPVVDILRHQVPPGTFRDRIVLVGATAVGTYDLRTTPVSALYPGTEILATVVDNVMTRRLLARPRWWKVFDLAAIVLLTVAAGFVVSRTGAVKGLLAVVALFAGYTVLAGWLFLHHGIWVSVVYPLLGLTLDYTALTAYRYLSEERERRKVKGAFQQYVAPEVVEEMLKDPATRLRLGGQEKVLTVLFSDLEGFTTYSEKYSPTEMIGILSEYYARMTEQVFANRGTLKEYVGDELMAFFGAPLDQPDHAIRACGTALAMRDARLKLNEEWASLGRPQLRARTGVNSGPMLVGNLGSKYRFAYGVLGDQVNLGSRLEGLNRTFGTSIIVGQNTAQLVGDAFVLRELDRVRAKGKKLPVTVHELVARTTAELTPQQQKVLALYAAGLEAYRQRRWDDAAARFQEALSVLPDDRPSTTMLERCRMYRQAPPPEPWDGVFEQTLKMLKDVG